MLARYVRCLAFFIVVPSVWCMPLNHDTDRGPLAAVSDLNSVVSGLSSRVASRAGLLPSERDPRLPLPSSKDLETIKKVAQILIMLGEQVLPSIFGERSSKNGSSVSLCETQLQQDTPKSTNTVKDK